MIVSGAAPPRVDTLRRVRRCMPRALASADCLGPFHYCAFCERATPDAPETIDDQRRCTGCRYRTIYGGSHGSASLPPAIADQVYYRVRAPGRASLPPLASRLRICRRLGDLFRCLHHDLKWNFCQTPKIRMFVELRLGKEWRAHSAAKAGDLSGRRQRLGLLLKQGCHLTKVNLRCLRLFCHANRPATGARTTAAMPAVPVEIFTKIMK